MNTGPGRRDSSPVRGAGALGDAAAGRPGLGAPRAGSAMGRDVLAQASARAAGSAKPPSSAANKDLLLESVLSAAEEPRLGADAKEGIRSVLADAVGTERSPGLDEKPVRDGRPSAKQRKMPVNAPSGSKAATRGKGAAADSAKKMDRRDLDKYSSDQVDKIYEYERENTALKSKQNLLEAEIDKMNTKLARINELMARTSKGSREGSKPLIPAEVQRHLQDEVNKLSSENEQMRDKNKKLRAIEKELTAKAITKKASTNKYAHVKGKLASAKIKQSEKEFERLLEELKVQLISGEKQIMHLTTQRDRLQQRQAGESHRGLETALEGQQRELEDVTRRITELKSSQHEKEIAFNNAKDAMEKKQQEIRDLARDCEDLRQRNFKIHSRAQAANDLKDTLKDIELERDQISEKITRLTSLPFLESSKSGEPAIQHSIARLRVQVEEAARNCEQTQAQEQAQQLAVDALKEKVQALKGESKAMKAQHQEVTEKYAQTQGGITLGAVGSDLKKMDEEAHQRALGDLQAKPENRQVWRGVEYVDGAEGAIDPLQSDDIKVVKRAVAKLKQQNKEFASELDKTETLLTLQKDIESETTKYLQEEQRRLELLAQQSALQAEEVSKKLAAQGTVIDELEKKLGYAKPGVEGVRGTPVGPSDERFAPGEPGDADSDFSAGGEEVKRGENIFDLKIVDGELDMDAIQRLLQQQGIRHEGELTTVVSVDFLDHDTSTTPAMQGRRPRYLSRFSFCNKMDQAYLHHMLKARQALEIWLLTPRRNLKIGVCEFPLATLAANELPGVRKPATIEDRLAVRPSAEFSAQMLPGQALGHLRIKMRLREPMSAAFQALRDREQVDQVTREASAPGGRPGTAGPRACLVTISVPQASNLRVASGKMAQIAPFFYYRFHTSDEKYSEASTGANPVFNSQDSYAVNLDETMRRYLESQTLDIAFFDDNAPVSGVPGGAQSGAAGQEVDDLIGICKVPLADLAEGIGINEDFTIKDLSGLEAGTARVQITIVDATSGREFHRKQTQKEIEQYRKGTCNDRWEAGIIQKIAAKLSRSRRVIDIDLMFGIFARGSKACTREDFKYCCLRSLNLKDELSERELDMFWSQHSRLRGKAAIDKEDFADIFSEAITDARNSALNKEADDAEQLRRYKQQVQETTRRATQASQYRTMDAPLSFADFQRKDAINVLMHVLKRVPAYEITRELTQSAQNGRIAPEVLRELLYKRGAADQDTRKITNLLTSQDKLSGTGADSQGAATSISVPKFAELLDDARLEASFSSAAVSKFNHIISQPIAQRLAECLLQKDMNRDREVNIDGFKASVIAAGIVDANLLTLSDLEEIFNLISVNGMLRYGEYMVEQDRRALQYFPKDSQQKIEESIGLAESSRTLDASVQQMTAPVEPTVKSKTIAAPTSAHILRTAKEKIERFLASQDVTLSMLFAVIDTNSDDPLSRQEFSRRLSAVQAGLEAEEVDALFTHLDGDRDGNISQREFMQAFSGANADQIVSRMRRVLFGASMSVKQLLSTHCGSGPISKLEFRKIVRALIDKLADFEIDGVFKELSGGAETLAREDFLDRFGRDEQEKQFQTGIEDILKPLGTFMRRKQVSVFTLFQDHDQDRNQMISAKELAVALRTTLKYELSPDEVNTMSDYFRARFKRAEVNKAQFGDLVRTAWVRKWEAARARAALAAIRAKLKEQGRRIEAVLATEARLTKDQVPLRAFKRAIYQLGAITQQQVNNLATYLDRYDDGMIRIEDVKLALSSDKYDPRKSSVAGRV